MYKLDHMFKLSDIQTLKIDYEDDDINESNPIIRVCLRDSGRSLLGYEIYFDHKNITRILLIYR